MFCLACGDYCGSRLCDACRASLAPGGSWVSPEGMRVTSALRHTGAARLLVHRLKYQALPGVADLLAEMIEPVLGEVSALVPVPRAVVRRWRHGVDPAGAIATALSRRTGLPVVEALRPGLWWPHHAGRGGRPRSAARLVARERGRQPPQPGWALVDDVATSGATLAAAAAALGGVGLAVVATAPGTLTAELMPRVPAWQGARELEVSWSERWAGRR